MITLGRGIPKLPRTDPRETAFQVCSALYTSKTTRHGSGAHQRTRQPEFQPGSWLLPSSLAVWAPSTYWRTGRRTHHPGSGWGCQTPPYRLLVLGAGQA